MSKLKKQDEVPAPKADVTKGEYLKVPLSVSQYNLISILLFAIYGGNRFDQLGVALYAAIQKVKTCRKCPLYCYVDAAANRKYEEMTGKTCGTSISGSGYQAMDEYYTYLGRVFGNEFLINSLSIAEVMISLLLFLVLSDQDMINRLKVMDPYPSIVIIDGNNPDRIKLCIFDLSEGTFDDSETYPLDEFTISLLDQSALEILKRKTKFVSDAKQKIRQNENKWVNETLLRLREETNVRAKTDENIQLRWADYLKGIDVSPATNVSAPNEGVEKGSKICQKDKKTNQKKKQN